MPRPRKVIPNIKYTPIAQAADFLLAEDCVTLLRDSELEAKVVSTKKDTYTVQVDDKRFNEAYVIIQTHLTPDGFFDIYNESIQVNDPNHAA